MSKENKEFLHALIDQSPIAIQIMTPDGRIVGINEAYEKLWKISLKDLSEYNILKDEQAKSLGLMPYIKRGFAGEALTLPQFEYDPVKIKSVKKGRKRWIQSNIYSIKDETGNLRNVVMMYEDITKRKQVEGKIEHLNLVLRAIRKVNQLITKEKDRDKLLKGACDNLIETRGYYNAWIALLGESSKFITTVEAGLGKDFLPMIEILKSGKITACGKDALKQTDVVVTETPFDTCKDCPLSERYEGRGAMTARLECHGKIYGIMSVSIPTEFLKNKQENNLFKEVTNDIALALHGIEAEEEPKQTEKSLKESEASYRSIFETALTSIIVINKDGLIIDINPYHLTHIAKGKTPKENFIGKNIITHPTVVKAGLSEVYIKVLKGESFDLKDVYFPLLTTGTDGYFNVKGKSLLKNGKVVGAVIMHEDITKRKIAESALQQSKEKYHLLVENAPSVLWKTSEKGITVFISSNIKKVYGYTPEEIYADGYNSWLGRIHHDDLQEVEKSFQALFGKGKKFEVEYRIKRKDGEWIWVHDVASVVSDENGERYAYGVFTDITERKVADAQILMEKEFTDTALDAQLDTFFLFEPATGKALRWNRTFRKISGYTDEEIARIPVPASYYSPEDLERAEAFTQKVFKEGTGTIELELICKDGRKVPTEYRVSAINDDQGKPKYIISIGRDITERKLAEEALRQSEKKFRTLFEEAPAAVTVLDNSGVVVSCNQATEKLTGYNRKEIIGKPFEKLMTLSPEDLPRLVEYYKKLVRSIKVEPYTLQIIRKNGKKCWIRVRNSLVRKGEEVIGIQVYAVDITARKQAEEALKKRNKELEHFYDVTVGRELKMLELKKEINELLEKSGEEPKYEIPE